MGEKISEVELERRMLDLMEEVCEDEAVRDHRNKDQLPDRKSVV